AYIGDKPSTKFVEFFGVLQECHDAVVPTMVPGESFHRVAARAAEHVQNRMPEFFALMHAIGIEQYDHPQTSGAFGGGDVVLEPGMTVHFETGYQELGWGVIHLEDTYLITGGEPERLNTLPREPL